MRLAILTPVLAVIPPDLALVPQPSEVARIFEVRCDHLFDPAMQQQLADATADLPPVRSFADLSSNERKRLADLLAASPSSVALVGGVRAKRQDSGAKRQASLWANRIRRKLLDAAEFEWVGCHLHVSLQMRRVPLVACPPV